MVVLEALACGVAVVMSSQVGASTLPGLKNIRVLDLSLTEVAWSEAVYDLDVSHRVGQKFRTWTNVAMEYLQLYTDFCTRSDECD